MSAPHTTVIVPTRDRPGPLRECLESLAAQVGAKPFEVLVVNDGGPLPELPDSPELIRSGGVGPAMARNIGAERARGDLLALIDDDCVAAPGWLAGLQRRASELPGCAVAGRTVNGFPDRVCSAASHVTLDACHRHYSSGGWAGFAASCNLALPAERFRAVGGFDPSFRYAEDRDLAMRWLSAGGRIAWADEAVVSHRRAMGLLRFFAQHLGYGRGAYALHRRRARDQGLPALEGGFYAALAREALRVRRARVRVAALTATTQLAAAVGYALEAAARRGVGRRRCPDPVLPMPVSFNGTQHEPVGAGVTDAGS